MIERFSIFTIGKGFTEEAFKRGIWSMQTQEMDRVEFEFYMEDLSGNLIPLFLSLHSPISAP